MKLEQVIHNMERLQKPIILRIYDEDVYENSTVMIELLRCHPEVRLKVYESNAILGHIRKLNWHGRRYLIDTSTKSVPLSLWPLVFENVNNSECCDDKSSVIYEFLKGPAFAARDDL